MACLPEGRSSHKHLGERNLTPCRACRQKRRLQDSIGIWPLPPAPSFSMVSMQSNKSSFQQSCQRNHLKTAVLAERTAACGPACWHAARRCCQAARPTSPATETEEPRLRCAPALPPSPKLPVRAVLLLARSSVICYLL